jgi:hypothetical protein
MTTGSLSPGTLQRAVQPPTPQQQGPIPAGPPQGPSVKLPQTATQKAWKNLNLSDSRLSVADEEVAALENMMYLGRGLQAVPLYNGSRGSALYAGALVKTAAGFMLTYTGGLPHPVVIVIFEDGSAWQRDLYLNGAIDTMIAPVGTFAASTTGGTGLAMWKDGPILILDEKSGYSQWNGATWTLIDATKKGRILAVFEGHVWLVTAARTVTYTAPDSVSDFTAGNGAGAFEIADEAFPGAIEHLHSTVEQLWIMGTFAIDALGNVATSGGVTTFSITNAIATLGTAFGESTGGYYRALTFYTGYSVHSLLGVTPQKLSASIDRLFPLLGPVVASGPRSGVVQLNGQTVLVFLVEFTDPVTGVVTTKLLCFQEGKWWTATTPDLSGNRVRDLVTLTVGSTPEVYGIDAGGFVYRIFARADDAKQGTGRVQSNLSDLGQPLHAHAATRFGVDLSAPSTTKLSRVVIALSSEKKTTTLAAEYVKFLPAGSDTLGRRYALHRKDAPIAGQRLGWTIEVECADLVCVEAAHWRVDTLTDWDIVDDKPATFVWTNGAAPFVWNNNQEAFLPGGGSIVIEAPWTWIN